MRCQGICAKQVKIAGKKRSLQQLRFCMSRLLAPRKTRRKYRKTSAFTLFWCISADFRVFRGGTGAYLAEGTF